MLAYLTRVGKSGEAVAVIEQLTLRLYEQGKLAKETAFASRALAIAELDKLVARRVKAGWKLRHRIESPWIDWRRELEQMWERTIANARAVGVTVSPSAMFQKLTPSSVPDDDTDPAYAELSKIGSVRMRFRLGDARLEHDYYFEIGTHRAAGDPFWQMRRGNDYEPEWGGWLKGGALENRIGDDTIRHASADEFRAWFPRFVRDDVMTFAIAELAKR